MNWILQGCKIYPKLYLSESAVTERKFDSFKSWNIWPKTTWVKLNKYNFKLYLSIKDVI